MRIVRQTPQELVVVDSSRWVSVICAAGAIFAAYRTISQGHQRQGLIAAAFLALCAMIFDLRKTFIFDAMQRVVRWKGRTILKAESGEIPFDAITNIDTETTTTSNNTATITLYRLAINASGTTIPMAYNYRGVSDGYAALRSQILEFVRPGSQAAASRPAGAAAESLESSLRGLLRQGRKMDAISLLRSSEKMSLSDAMTRIDAIERGIKQEE